MHRIRLNSFDVNNQMVTYVRMYRSNAIVLLIARAQVVGHLNDHHLLIVEVDQKLSFHPQKLRMIDISR